MQISSTYKKGFENLKDTTLLMTTSVQVKLNPPHERSYEETVHLNTLMPLITLAVLHELHFIDVVKLTTPKANPNSKLNLKLNMLKVIKIHNTFRLYVCLWVYCIAEG